MTHAWRLGGVLSALLAGATFATGQTFTDWAGWSIAALPDHLTLTPDLPSAGQQQSANILVDRRGRMRVYAVEDGAKERTSGLSVTMDLVGANGVAESVVGGNFDAYVTGAEAENVVGVRGYVNADASTTKLLGGEFGIALQSSPVTGYAAAISMYGETYSGASVPALYGTYFTMPEVGGAAGVTTLAAHWVGNLIGSAVSPYAFWYDGGAGADCNSGAVTRINDVGIFAYYNPCFAKYVPAAIDFERLILRWGDTGVFGTDNVAYVGVEKGGTGAARHLQLIGGGLSFQSTLVTPASAGTRFLCISTTGVVRSSAKACVGE